MVEEEDEDEEDIKVRGNGEEGKSQIRSNLAKDRKEGRSQQPN